ncbi:MAG TPA: response regulator transcription factor [Mycobacteriales bacterium]|jgi:DNA-binding NarL/FixJ family response regulator|nr:response regulator transcription factor [Mycobacteriales bacterium]
MTTVLICDDHRLVREGLSRSVQSVPGVDRVDTAVSGEEVLARWPSERQDLVLMDVHMPGLGGVEAVRRLVHAHPTANVVMLTGAADREAVAMAISGGARGFLHKDVSREELCAAVANALASAELLSGLTDRIPTQPAGPELTEREMQVLRGMASGKSNAQIGRDLYLSEDTIKTHARRLFRKMRVNDRAQAVASGFRLGLVR